MTQCFPKRGAGVLGRMEVNEGGPGVKGTTAALEGGGVTGVSKISLEGAVKDAPPITDKGPAGRPVIPTRVGGLGELLNTAPQLLQRLSTLSERLGELANDKKDRKSKRLNSSH